MSVTRNLAIVRLNESDLLSLIKPPDGTKLVSVHANWERATIDVALEGPNLPPCEMGMIPKEMRIVTVPRWHDDGSFMGLALHWEWVPDEESPK